MSIGRFFVTPARRIAAVVSSIVLVVCISFFCWTAASLRIDLGNQWLDIDQEYIDEYVSEFGANRVYFGPSRGWKYTKRYSKELAVAKQELETLIKAPVACPKIDKRFEGRTGRIGTGFFTYENTPFGWLEMLYASCKTSPKCSGLRSLKEQIACYRNCDCSGFNEEYFGLVRSTSTGFIYLKDTPFFAATFDYFFWQKIESANYKYKVVWLFVSSILLLLFAFGCLEPVFSRIRKISLAFLKWIKCGE